MRTAVIGAGAWGTALADLLAKNGHAVALWAYESDVVSDVNAHHANRRYLRGASIHAAVRATSDVREAVTGAELVVFVTPSHVLRAVIRSCAPHVSSTATIVVASKGIEAETLALMTDVAAQELPGRAVVAFSGPSFAAEVAAGQPTAVVAASANPAAARDDQANHHFHICFHRI